MEAREFKWIRLDNAAKIYPASRRRDWMAMFRLSATLTEKVDEELLQAALERTAKRFPGFSLRLRNGMFWYYLERVNEVPKVQHDVANPCALMSFKENDGLMYRVRYHENRIAVEIFHVLSDGTGGMCFLKTLTAEYLTLKYGIEIPRDTSILDCDEKPKAAELEDSFSKYARTVTSPRSETPAYRISGSGKDPNDLRIITGLAPVDRVKAVAAKYKATVAELLVSVLIMSVYSLQRREISTRRRSRQIKVNVPVNMRRFYPTSTLRNFSLYVNPGIVPEQGEWSFEETLARVKHYMGMEVTEKNLNAMMSTNVAAERNRLLRVMPLFIKNTAMRMVFIMTGDRLSSTTLSNLGNVTLAPSMAKYVERMDFQLGSLSYNPVTCACVSCNNVMSINFTRIIDETDVEREFFTTLVKMGIPVKIESNQRY